MPSSLTNGKRAKLLLAPKDLLPYAWCKSPDY